MDDPEKAEAGPSIDDGPDDDMASSPGDGTLAPPPEAGDADRVQTVERGREAEAARANMSDSLPVPTETPAP